MPASGNKTRSAIRCAGNARTAPERRPKPNKGWSERIAACDGLLLSTPEYNNSVPGVFKNAVDWTTRPAADITRVFRGKRVALMGASPGGFGTILSQNAWLPIFNTLGMQHWTAGRLLVSRATNVFDVDGNLVDEDVRKRLRSFLEGFVGFLGIC